MPYLPRLALAFSLFVAFASNGHGFEPAQISLTGDAHDQAQIEVTGTWPNTCPPQLLEVSRQGADLTLLATREDGGCQPIPTPYGFSGPLPQAANPDEAGIILRTRLLVSDQLHESPMLAGFALLRAEPGNFDSVLETGFWWAEQEGPFAAGPGLGLSLESQADLISLSVMGYDTHGNATWYFGAGTLEHGMAQLELGRFDGGAGPFTPYAAPGNVEYSGTVALEMLTPSRAILWFSRIDDADNGGLELRPLSIMRFHFAREPADALLGRWVVTGENAGVRGTRWIELVRSESFADGFVLYDGNERAVLQCDTPVGHPGSPPVLCRMDDGHGDLVEFSEVALRRLAGRDARNRRTLAFRLD